MDDTKLCQKTGGRSRKTENQILKYETLTMQISGVIFPTPDFGLPALGPKFSIKITVEPNIELNLSQNAPTHPTH
jgi:hypothetical protein